MGQKVDWLRQAGKSPFGHRRLGSGASRPQRVQLRALALLLALMSAPGIAVADPTWVSGVGAESCAHWTADQQAAVSEFALGYFTGANAILADQGKGGLTGSAIQSSGVLKMVSLECRQHPSEAIAVAVAMTYHQLRGAGSAR